MRCKKVAITNKPIQLKAVVTGFLALTLFVLSPISHANDLGVYGAIYSISEPDMLTGIYTRLNVMQKDGELDRKNQEFKKRAIAHILRPTPVAGVSNLGSAKTTWHYFNPTIKVNHDITDTLGRIVAHKGQLVNPLKMMRLNEILYVINGDDSKQIVWIKKQIKISDSINQKIKIILVNGNIKTTAKAINNRVYFDQYGKLCKTFKIKHTPTVVYEPVNDGMILPRLMVKEVHDV